MALVPAGTVREFGEGVSEKSGAGSTIRLPCTLGDEPFTVGVPLTVKADVPTGVALVVVTVSALVVEALGTVCGLKVPAAPVSASDTADVKPL